ncbi:hypothetical protein Q5762_22520 [Streptomyces sp. P9(2023)]|uniref:hypothetical protein n=1 Tax=Streptomyces sp. P9(2023) TaxID=3064394 RepID=UPI0028F4068F|nr:hypothetical protein [Streptomyces sp. P9(2023)]MDT9691072.1 hypothetical protein [Streptomyces sp. P9(2023)]
MRPTDTATLPSAGPAEIRIVAATAEAAERPALSWLTTSRPSTRTGTHVDEV